MPGRFPRGPDMVSGGVELAERVIWWKVVMGPIVD